MNIPTEPIGSIPRPLKLLKAITQYGSSYPCLETIYDEAVRRFSKIRSRVEGMALAKDMINGR